MQLSDGLSWSASGRCKGEPEIEADDKIIDNACSNCSVPNSLTHAAENLYGDIVSICGAGLMGVLVGSRSNIGERGALLEACTALRRTSWPGNRQPHGAAAIRHLMLRTHWRTRAVRQNARRCCLFCRSKSPHPRHRRTARRRVADAIIGK